MYSSNPIGSSAPAAQAGGPGSKVTASSGSSSWYSQLADAWGAALDRQADKTAALAKQLTNGHDEPAAALQVSAAAHQLAFISTAASTASNSIGQALETLGRKQ